MGEELQDRLAVLTAAARSETETWAAQAPVSDKIEPDDITTIQGIVDPWKLPESNLRISQEYPSDHYTEEAAEGSLAEDPEVHVATTAPHKKLHKKSHPKNTARKMVLGAALVVATPLLVMKTIDGVTVPEDVAEEAFPAPETTTTTAELPEETTTIPTTPETTTTSQPETSPPATSPKRSGTTATSRPGSVTAGATATSSSPTFSSTTTPTTAATATTSSTSPSSAAATSPTTSANTATTAATTTTTAPPPPTRLQKAQQQLNEIKTRLENGQTTNSVATDNCATITARNTFRDITVERPIQIYVDNVASYYGVFERQYSNGVATGKFAAYLVNLTYKDAEFNVTARMVRGDLQPEECGLVMDLSVSPDKFVMGHKVLYSQTYPTGERTFYERVANIQ